MTHRQKVLARQKKRIRTDYGILNATLTATIRFKSTTLQITEQENMRIVVMLKSTTEKSQNANPPSRTARTPCWA